MRRKCSTVDISRDNITCHETDTFSPDKVPIEKWDIEGLAALLRE
jgi:hypothetical protein